VVAGVTNRIPNYSCGRPEHGLHIPHLMRCVKCAYFWMDCPGETGVNYKVGCPACSGIYWTAERARQVGKLKELIKASKVH
jgi:hypothetical protein